MAFSKTAHNLWKLLTSKLLFFTIFNLLKEEVQSQDDLEESDDLIPDEVDLTPNFSFNNSETSHGFVPGEPEIIDLRSN